MQNIEHKNTEAPMVSIGVPVYNGEQTLRAALNSLTTQSFQNFEIIISDNASTDETQKICESFSQQDDRFIYIRQEKNIGAAKNFEFVFQQAKGKYFMWAAADDIRSENFIEENLNFLERNIDYVASTSPNCFEKIDGKETKKITFSLEGDFKNRVDEFLENAWISHGIIFSLIRTKVLKNYPLPFEHFIGVDWAINIFMISKGKIHRTSKGLMTSGASGISSNKNPWRPYRTNFICWAFPFYKFSLFTLQVSNGTAIIWRFKLLVKLLKLNFNAMKDQIIAELYIFYVHHIKTHRKKKTENRLTL